MPRPQKDGLDYFPLDVTFFTDPKIKILKARYGVDGIAVYIYLLCEIYRVGYYLQLNEDSIYIFSDDLKMSAEKVMQVLNFLLERSLFSNKLFQSDKVLTSAGIQKRFQLAVKERAKKNPVNVEGFWLLPPEKTEPFIKVHPHESNSGKNEDNSGKNLDSSREKSLKESKEKESKGKEGEKPPLLGKYQNVQLTDEERATLEKSFGTKKVSDYIERLSWHIHNTGRRYNDHKGTMEKWIREDQAKQDEQKISKNRFHNFEQRDTDYNALVMKRLNERLQGGKDDGG